MKPGQPAALRDTQLDRERFAAAREDFLRTIQDALDAMRALVSAAKPASGGE